MGEILYVSQIYAKNYVPEFPQLESVSREDLYCIVHNGHMSTLTRCAAFVALLQHHREYFNSFDFCDKKFLLQEFNQMSVLVDNDGIADYMGDYIVHSYEGLITAESELIDFAKIVALRDTSEQILPRILGKLQNTDATHVLFRQLTHMGNYDAALRLATFAKEEDVSLLSCCFLGGTPPGRIGLALPQFPSSSFQFSCLLPAACWGLIFALLPAVTKIQIRLVCKQWFNDLNDELMWKNMCKEGKFVQIPLFSWSQSYFLQAQQLVQKYDNYNYFLVGNYIPQYNTLVSTITQSFPHPLFLSLLSLGILHLGNVHFVKSLICYPRSQLLTFLKNLNKIGEKSIPYFGTLYFEIKQQGWHSDPELAPLNIKCLPSLYTIIDNEALEILYNNNREELIAKLMEIIRNNEDFDKFFIGPGGLHYATLMKIIEAEPEVYNAWKLKLLDGVWDIAWHERRLIPKIIDPYLTREELIVPLLAAKLRTTRNKMLKEQCENSLGNFATGRHVLLDMQTANAQYSNEQPGKNSNSCMIS